mgnify:CR=1 FL=1
MVSETQSSSRVCCDPDLATEIRQDPAVCVSLPSNSIVKEQNREHKTRPTADRRIFSRRMSPSGTSGSGPKGFESLMPCEGGEAVMPANEAPLNNIAAEVSTLIFKFVAAVDRCRIRASLACDYSDLCGLALAEVGCRGRCYGKNFNLRNFATNPPGFSSHVVRTVGISQ